MTKRQKMHISPHEKGWQLKKERAERALKTFKTKKEAVDFGINKARALPLSQLIIHKKDGKIQEERTYGNDPYPPKG